MGLEFMKIKRKLKRKINAKYCECGCGQEVTKERNRFIQGHSWFGKKHSAQTRIKIGLANKGKIFSEKTRKKLSLANKGKIFSEKTRKKLSKAQTGKILSEETKKKISKANKGIVFSKENILKRSISLMRCRIDGYCDAWSDNEYKNECRKDYCESCEVEKEIKIITYWRNNKKAVMKKSNLLLHHIDFDKKNCNPDNLQTLCRICHMKLHHLASK